MDVIIIGAGIAGLAATDELTRAGIKPTIVEARDRIGGRIFTLNDDHAAAPIELGAEFVHGRPQQIFDLAKRFGLEIVETAGHSWKLNDNTELVPVDDEPPGSDSNLWGRADKYIGNKERDVSFEEFLSMPTTADVPDGEKEWARRFAAGFHAADLRKAGIYGLVKTQNADEEIDGEIAHRISRGYSALANEFYAQSQEAGAKYLLSHIVKSIKWSGPTIEILVRGSSGRSRSLMAKKVVITVPITVLKAVPGSAAHIEFLPDITQKRETLKHIKMGSADRIVLTFTEEWWTPLLQKIDPRRSKLGFLFAQDIPISVWWSNEPSEAPMLTGWVGGQKARETAEFTNEQLTNLAVSSLSKIFGTGESFITGKLTASFRHNWNADTFSLGAYTYMGIGGADAPDDLAKPVDNKLYFAGEATDVNGHWGTVHGAIASGKRVAREIIDDV